MPKRKQPDGPPEDIATREEVARYMDEAYLKGLPMYERDARMWIAHLGNQLKLQFTRAMHRAYEEEYPPERRTISVDHLERAMTKAMKDALRVISRDDLRALSAEAQNQARLAWQRIHDADPELVAAQKAYAEELLKDPINAAMAAGAKKE